MKLKNETLNRETTQELMEFQGQIRGVFLRGDAEVILRREGEKGLKKIEEKLRKIGFPIEYHKIKTLDFYPGRVKALSLLAIKEVFGYNDKDIKDIGRMSSKFSLIIKLYAKYFSSISKLFFVEVPKMWKMYWTVGESIPLELNEKEKLAIVRIENLNLYPIYCNYLREFFPLLAQLVLGARNITCQETKCVFEKGSFHEFLLKWQ